jgi:hypothetical protein
MSGQDRQESQPKSEQKFPARKASYRNLGSCFVLSLLGLARFICSQVFLQSINYQIKDVHHNPHISI